MDLPILTVRKYEEFVDNFCSVYNTNRRMLEEKYPYHIVVSYDSENHDWDSPIDNVHFHNFCLLVRKALSEISLILTPMTKYDDEKPDWRDMLNRYLDSVYGIVNISSASWEISEPVDVEIQLMYKKHSLKRILEKLDTYEQAKHLC